MKKYIYTLLFSIVGFLLNNTNAQESVHSTNTANVTIHKESGYVIISNEKFKEIEVAMKKQEDWSPILLEGFKKEELIAFYIQSYDDETILTYVDFAFKKVHNFEEIKPDNQQERKLQKARLQPRTRENAFLFMMLLTTKQIEIIGY